MLNEKLILQEIRNGNERVFESIFHSNYHSLVRFANSFLLDINSSEDIVQGVFSNIWENADSIQFKSITAYLYQATKNSCLNHLRSLQIRDKHEILYLEAIINTVSDFQKNSELLDSVKKALANLPEQMYEVFYKKYFQELSVKEIADEMSLSESTVKVQLHRGRNTIRKKIKSSTGIYLFL